MPAEAKMHTSDVAFHGRKGICICAVQQLLGAIMLREWIANISLDYLLVIVADARVQTLPIGRLARAELNRRQSLAA